MEGHVHVNGFSVPLKRDWGTAGMVSHIRHAYAARVVAGDTRVDNDCSSRSSLQVSGFGIIVVDGKVS
jgi:hypothetical protein